MPVSRLTILFPQGSNGSDDRHWVSGIVNKYTERQICQHPVRSGKCNFVDKVVVNNIRIVEVMDYKDNLKDSFQALVDGSMID